MVSKVDRTVDYGFKSWPYCWLWFQRLTGLSTVVLFSKKTQLLQLVDCRFFVDFASSISAGKWQNSYKMASKSSKNLSKSTVDYVADPRSCNSWPFSRKLTILWTMVSKVDHTVDYAFKSWPYCRLWFQKLTGLSTVEISKKKSHLLQLVDCRFFVDIAVDFSSDFSGKVEEFVQNMASKSSKITVKVNSRLRGRSEILQQLIFLEKVDHTVDYAFKSWPYC